MKIFNKKNDKQNFTCVIKYFSVATALCSIGMQNIQIFYQGPVMLTVTCFKQNYNE